MEATLAVPTADSIGQGSREILDEMNATIDRLKPLRNRISSICARIYGAEPTDIEKGEDRVSPDNFMQQRQSMQSEISALISEMEGKVERIETFI